MEETSHFSNSLKEISLHMLNEFTSCQRKPVAQIAEILQNKNKKKLFKSSVEKSEQITFNPTHQNNYRCAEEKGKKKTVKKLTFSSK